MYIYILPLTASPLSSGATLAACGLAGQMSPTQIVRNKTCNIYVFILPLTASPLSSGAALAAFGLAGPSSPPSPW